METGLLRWRGNGKAGGRTPGPTVVLRRPFIRSFSKHNSFLAGRWRPAGRGQ